VSGESAVGCLERRSGLADRRRKATELYRLYGPVVYRRCLKLLRDADAAQDATQEVFMKLVRDMERLEDRETVLPWLYRVATNHCLNARRTAHRRGEDQQAPELEIAAGSASDSYPDRALAQRVLSQFDDDTQAIAVGVLVDGMEHDELAIALGVSSRTVSRRLQRFLERAREIAVGGAS
jgi:RNA polymerase sigma-70 factor (ECF subfamily)